MIAKSYIDGCIFFSLLDNKLSLYLFLLLIMIGDVFKAMLISSSISNNMNGLRIIFLNPQVTIASLNLELEFKSCKKYNSAIGN